jgi:hypothetical protein
MGSPARPPVFDVSLIVQTTGRFPASTSPPHVGSVFRPRHERKTTRPTLAGEARTFAEIREQVLSAWEKRDPADPP